jgi:hypothetical protein
MIFALQHRFGATPANGQWPFAHLLCKGAASQKKLPGSARCAPISDRPCGRKHA